MKKEDSSVREATRALRRIGTPEALKAAEEYEKQKKRLDFGNFYSKRRQIRSRHSHRTAQFLYRRSIKVVIMATFCFIVDEPSRPFPRADTFPRQLGQIHLSEARLLGLTEL